MESTNTTNSYLNARSSSYEKKQIMMTTQSSPNRKLQNLGVLVLPSRPTSLPRFSEIVRHTVKKSKSVSELTSREVSRGIGEDSQFNYPFQLHSGKGTIPKVPDGNNVNNLNTFHFMPELNYTPTDRKCDRSLKGVISKDTPNSSPPFDVGAVSLSAIKNDNISSSVDLQGILNKAIQNLGPLESSDAKNNVLRSSQIETTPAEKSRISSGKFEKTVDTLDTTTGFSVSDGCTLNSSAKNNGEKSGISSGKVEKTVDTRDSTTGFSVSDGCTLNLSAVNNCERSGISSSGEFDKSVESGHNTASFVSEVCVLNKSALKNAERSQLSASVDLKEVLNVTEQKLTLSKDKNETDAALSEFSTVNNMAPKYFQTESDTHKENNLENLITHMQTRSLSNVNIGIDHLQNQEISPMMTQYKSKYLNNKGNKEEVVTNTAEQRFLFSDKTKQGRVFRGRVYETIDDESDNESMIENGVECNSRRINLEKKEQCPNIIEKDRIMLVKSEESGSTKSQRCRKDSSTSSDTHKIQMEENEDAVDKRHFDTQQCSGLPSYTGNQPASLGASSKRLDNSDTEWPTSQEEMWLKFADRPLLPLKPNQKKKSLSCTNLVQAIKRISKRNSADNNRFLASEMAGKTLSQTKEICSSEDTVSKDCKTQELQLEDTHLCSGVQSHARLQPAGLGASSKRLDNSHMMWMTAQDDKLGYLKEIYESMERKNYTWFHQVDAREACKRLLSLDHDGVFLIRPTSRPSKAVIFTLCVTYHRCVYNMYIRNTSNGLIAIGKKKKHEMTFSSMLEMIHFHQNVPLSLYGAPTEEEGKVYLLISPAK